MKQYLTKRVIIEIAALILIVILGAVYFVAKRDYSSSIVSTSTPAEAANQEQTSTYVSDPSTYTLIVKGEKNSFYCDITGGYESPEGCEIFVNSNGVYSDTGIGAANTKTDLLLSPDKAHILVLYVATNLGASTGGDRAVIMNVNDASSRIVYQAPPNTYLGTIDSNINVYGQAKWLDNSHIQINVYAQGNAGNADRNEVTGDNGGKASSPIKTEIVTI